MSHDTNRIEPGPGQESVWDYPRPPNVEDCKKQIRVIVNGQVIAESSRSKRVLETSHPPVYYIPPEDVRLDLLRSAPGVSLCEWKGRAGYYDVVIDNLRVPASGLVLPDTWREIP